MPVSPQMRIALGHMYERDTQFILEDLGFTNIQWMNEKGESRLSYDYTATKDGEDYFIEVKSYYPSRPIPFSQRKLDALAPLGKVWLVLWHVKDEVVDITSLDDALRSGLINLNEKTYLKRTYRRLRRRTTITLPTDRLEFLDNCAELTRKDRSEFLTLLIDEFNDEIVSFAKNGYVTWICKLAKQKEINHAEKLESVPAS
jgi:hypothetical protein